jgi:hypothetical protein
MSQRVVGRRPCDALPARMAIVGGTLSGRCPIFLIVSAAFGGDGTVCTIDHRGALTDR